MIIILNSRPHLAENQCPLNLPGNVQAAGLSEVPVRLNQSLGSGSATSSWVVVAAAVAVVVVESAFGDAQRRDPDLA